MIRVGFVFNYKGDGWLGGVNYFRNLIHAILSNQERKIAPVILVGQKLGTDLPKEFQDAEIIKSYLFDTWSPFWIMRNLVKRSFRRDLLLEKLLKKHRIQLLSHASFLGIQSKIPALCWIPDFQHLHLSDFFTKKELVARNRNYKQLSKRCQGIILSSYYAKKDLEKLCPEAITKTYVMHFVSTLADAYDRVSLTELKEKYGISMPYFHVPNQFWKHKNHIVLLEALRILKKKGERVLLVATGSTGDYRNPEHFNSLMTQSKEYDILDSFKVLGIVPFADLVSLMYHSLALVNPSLFEGWSSTVEEAKSLGKTILLSDIPVHREQNPQRSLFFGCNDHRELADALIQVQKRYDPGEDQEAKEQARAVLPMRRDEFCRTYEQIVLEIISKHNTTP